MGKTKSPAKRATKPAAESAAKSSARKVASQALPALAADQLWLVEGKHLRVGLVGPLMVHYRLGKPDAPKTVPEINSKAAIEKYLKQKKAKLLKG